MSTGSDPFGAFQRFAADMDYQNKILSISLGQGQGPVAEKMIEEGRSNGSWVFLQVTYTYTTSLHPMHSLYAIPELPLGHILDVTNGAHNPPHRRRPIQNAREFPAVPQLHAIEIVSRLDSPKFRQSDQRTTERSAS